MTIVTTDIYSFIYTTLVNQILAEVPDVVHVDLYDSQPLQPKEDQGYNLPAVFIDFRPVSWTMRGDKSRRAELQIDIHIETSREGVATADNTPNAQQPRGLYYLTLINKIYKALLAYNSGDVAVGFSSMVNIGDALNTNDNVTRVDILNWKTNALDATAVPTKVPLDNPTQTITITGNA